MSGRTLIVLGDAVAAFGDDRPHPRRDYAALAERLDADILDASVLGRRRGRFRDGVLLARRAAALAPAYDNVYCDSEHIGLPLAWALRAHRRPRLTMIAHYLTPAKKALPARLLRLPRRIDAVVLHSPTQADRARWIGFGTQQVHIVPYQVDERFWQPSPPSPGSRLIASVGQEFRDYRTLVEAMRGLDAEADIAAGSYWSSRARNISDRELPHNVRMRRRGYDELLALYRASAFVVVPLHDVDFQAGIITILEAMAMARAVVVSRTRGQTGVISGPLLRDGHPVDIGERAWPADTGVYVTPGDPAALRAAIERLLADPAAARRMGEAGRAHVEATFTLDRFVDRLAPIIEGRAPVAAMTP